MPDQRKRSSGKNDGSDEKMAPPWLLPTAAILCLMSLGSIVMAYLAGKRDDTHDLALWITAFIVCSTALVGLILWTMHQESTPPDRDDRSNPRRRR